MSTKINVKQLDRSVGIMRLEDNETMSYEYIILTKRFKRANES